MDRTVAAAGGYAGGELLRLLAGHPDLELTAAAAAGSAGRPVAEARPHLGPARRPGVRADRSGGSRGGRGVPRPAARSRCELAGRLADVSLVVDLGPDHRLADPAARARFSGAPHTAPWAYGVPEQAGGRDRLAGARRIAAPAATRPR